MKKKKIFIGLILIILCLTIVVSFTIPSLHAAGGTGNPDYTKWTSDLKIIDCELFDKSEVEKIDREIFERGIRGIHDITELSSEGVRFLERKSGKYNGPYWGTIGCKFLIKNRGGKDITDDFNITVKYSDPLDNEKFKESKYRFEKKIRGKEIVEFECFFLKFSKDSFDIAVTVDKNDEISEFNEVNNDYDFTFENDDAKSKCDLEVIDYGMINEIGETPAKFEIEQTKYKDTTKDDKEDVPGVQYCEFYIKNNGNKKIESEFNVVIRDEDPYNKKRFKETTYRIKKSINPYKIFKFPHELADYHKGGKRKVTITVDKNNEVEEFDENNNISVYTK